jgi:PRTRC genetic system protein C
MQTQELIRAFKHGSVALPDPSPSFTIGQVRDFYANVYPELLNADIEGPETVGNKQTYTFRRAVGTKGNLMCAFILEKLLNDESLVAKGRPKTTISKKALNTPLSVALLSIAGKTAQSGTTRHLAAPGCMSVLP